MVNIANLSNTNENDEENKKQKGPDKRFGARHVQIFLCFFQIQIAFILRTNFKVALEFMTDTNKSSTDVPTYEWDHKNVIFSSFYWGYILTPIIAGFLVERYGPKWFLAATMTLDSILHLLIPVVADNLGSPAVIVIRVVQGLFQGFYFPSVYTVLAKWTPLSEKTGNVALMIATSVFGTLLSHSATQKISETSIGWPITFYIVGGIGLLWVPFWIFFHVNSPSQHKTIPEDERNFIEERSYKVEDYKLQPTPWKVIFRSLPLWTIIVVSFVQNWGNYTLNTITPEYINNVMDYDLESNAALAAAPLVVQGNLILFCAKSSDYLIKFGIPAIKLRKIMNFNGVCSASLTLIILACIPTDQTTVALVFLVIGVGFNGAIFSSFQVNLLEMAPNHSGILFGVMESFSNIATIVLSLISSNETDHLFFTLVFITSAVMYTVSGFFYLKCADTNVQVWNDLEDEESWEDRL